MLSNSIVSLHLRDQIPELKKNHRNADALSRLPLPEVKTTTSSVVTCFDLGQIDALPVTCETIQRATRRDLILSKVMTYVKNGWPKQISESFYHRKLELTIECVSNVWNSCDYSFESSRICLG